MRSLAALDLAIAGHDYQTIADTVGYASRGAAFNAVQRELDRLLTPKAEQLRKMHQRRLNKLRTVYFPKAMAGDGWSADRVLRFDEREAQLMGLDAKVEPSANGPVIIEVPGSLADAIRGVPHIPPMLERQVSDE